jgi:hypothetical protein
MTTLKNYRVVAAASTNAALIKEGPAEVVGVILANTAAAVKYVKLYDKATAPDQNDTPIFTFALPAGRTEDISLPARLDTENGLGIRITNLPADNDNTAVTAVDVIAHILYR